MIVDDEALARRGLRRLLDGKVDVIGEASSVKNAADLIREHRPDAIFLDIEMRGDTGFRLLAALDDPPDVVFVTAHSQYAVKAYDIAAVDYLLKPVLPARLAAALEKLEKAHAERQRQRASGGDVLRLKTRGRTMMVRIDALAALQAERDYTRVFAADMTPVLSGESLGQLEKQLPSPPFVRLGRSLIINRDRVEELAGSGRNMVQLVMSGCATPLALGRAAAARLKKAMAE